jgi:hypothetical protein
LQTTEQKINEVEHVGFFIKHPEYKAYGFVTKEIITIKELNHEADFFHLLVHDDGLLEIMIGNDKDFDIHGEATSYFDIEAIKKICEVADPLPDLTKDYIAYYETQGEEF